MKIKSSLLIYISGKNIEFFLRILHEKLFFLNSRAFGFTSKGTFYDRQTLRIANLALSVDSDWIDAGAHIGGFSRKFKKIAPLGQGYSFEPIPSLSKIIKRRISEISVSQIALSNFCGEKQFEFIIDDPANSALSHRPDRVKNRWVEEITVRVQRLDCYFQNVEHNIGFIKIDVEGAEYELLEGAENLIVRDRPIIVFETGNATLPKIYRWFEEIGYSVDFLSNFPTDEPYGKSEFLKKSSEKGEFYFVAYPKKQ
jgi:FkbM family methyltransferase